MSLAVIFLVGTYRVDIFTLGYIAYVFMFLWMGTDFYAKKLRTIVRWWDKLLAFTVTVIVIKMGIKILGCQFGYKNPLAYCWS